MIGEVYMEGEDTMSTKSFFDTVVIEKKDVERLRYIMNDKRNIKIERVKNHKELKGKELKEFIKLLK